VHVALGILAIVATVVAVTAVANRVRFPAPVLLLLVGVLGSYLPFVDEPELTPELILLGFLPPLLYAAAIRSSLVEIRANSRSIAFLSVLLVALTALGIGLVTWLILPVPFAVAFALGAVVAPPDAVAATAIARRIGMPRRIVTILEGESLVNDATAITCLRVALIAMAGGVTAWEVTLGFCVSALGGTAIGLVVAVAGAAVRRRVHDPVLDTAISLMVPFAAYLPAESLEWGGFHPSGVLAVVIAGLVLGHKSPVIQTPRSRISERLNWATIQFLLENAVFLLIGLQTRRIVASMAESTLAPTRIALFCAAALVGVILLRLVWVTAAGLVLFRPTVDHTQAGPLDWRATLVVGWAGLRGVVTLAAAFLIPPTVEHRPVLVFAAMVVTAGTLLLQGLTLPWLVRRLGLRGPDPRADALQAATVLQTSGNAALFALENLPDSEVSTETRQMLQNRIRSRANSLWERLGASSDVETPTEEYRRLRLHTLQIERDQALRLRSTGLLDHEVVSEVLASFDVEESTLQIAVDRSDRLVEEPVSAPRQPGGECVHLANAPTELEPTGPTTCQDCVREGTRPVHLRICLDCGTIGCCDSSVGRHAHRHFTRTGHPVIASFEPQESWRWCYLDQRLG
jgi:Na+/H+ antiporter